MDLSSLVQMQKQLDLRNETTALVRIGKTME